MTTQTQQADERKKDGVIVLRTLHAQELPLIIPHSSYTFQDGWTLPKMRPPILLNTDGIPLADLAHVLTRLNTGDMECWEYNTPIPVTVCTAVNAHAEHRLLASSPCVRVVLPRDTLHTARLLAGTLLPLAKRQATTLWLYPLQQPSFPYPVPDLARLLSALTDVRTLAEAHKRYGFRRQTFDTHLARAAQALRIPRHGERWDHQKWYQALFDGLAL